MPLARLSSKKKIKADTTVSVGCETWRILVVAGVLDEDIGLP